MKPRRSSRRRAFDLVATRSAETPPRVRASDACSPEIAEQLRKHLRRLQRAHPNLHGIGIGLRRKQGRVVPETAVRLIVTGKPRRNARLSRTMKRLPARLPLRVIVLGQEVVVRVPTDVENVTAFRRTQFRIEKGRAAAFAVWTEPDGQRAVGIVSAGHVLPPVGSLARFQLQSGEAQALVIARSELVADGVDVGLALIDPTSAGDAAPIDVPALPAAAVTEWMGDDQDGLELPARFWSKHITDALAAVAYYVEFPLDYGGGLVITMRDAVECRAAQDVFVPGRSGSMWGCRTPDQQLHTLAIQSHATKNGARGVGTHVDTAVAWLRWKLDAPDLELRYLAKDLG